MVETKQKPDVSGPCKEMLDAIHRYSEHIGKYGGTLWEGYVVTCLSCGDVQKCFVNHVERKEQYLGARCWAGPGLPGEAWVLFTFQRPAPAYDLLPEAFLAKLNLCTHTVEVCDPYSGHLLRCGPEEAARWRPAWVPASQVQEAETTHREERRSSSKQ